MQFADRTRSGPGPVTSQLYGPTGIDTRHVAPAGWLAQLRPADPCLAWAGFARDGRPRPSPAVYAMIPLVAPPPPTHVFLTAPVARAVSLASASPPVISVRWLHRLLQRFSRGPASSNTFCTLVVFRLLVRPHSLLGAAASAARADAS